MVAAGHPKEMSGASSIPPLPPDEGAVPRINRSGCLCERCGYETVRDRKPGADEQATYFEWCVNPDCPYCQRIIIR